MDAECAAVSLRSATDKNAKPTHQTAPTNLHTLSLTNTTNFTDAHIEAICQINPHLEQFLLNHGGVFTDKSLASIATQLKKLQSLSFSVCGKATDVGMEHLSTLVDLTELYCETRHVTEKGFLVLAKKQGRPITELCVGSSQSTTSLTCDCLQHFTALTKLRIRYALGLSSLSLGSSLGNMTNLSRLAIHYCGNLPEGSFRGLKNKLLNLIHFTIGSIAFGDEDFRAVASACPNLTNLTLTKASGLTSKGLRHVAMLKHLTSLHVDRSGTEVIGDDDSKWLDQTELHLSGLCRLSGRSFEVISSLGETLTSVELAFNDNSYFISDVNLQLLGKGLTRLRRLMLCGVSVNNEIALALGPNTRLESVALHRVSGVSESDLLKLMPQLRLLSHLRLFWCFDIVSVSKLQECCEEQHVVLVAKISASSMRL